MFPRGRERGAANAGWQRKWAGIDAAVNEVHLEVIGILYSGIAILAGDGVDARGLPIQRSVGRPTERVAHRVTTPDGDKETSEVLHRTADNGAVLDVAVGPPLAVGPGRWEWTIRTVRGSAHHRNYQQREPSVDRVRTSDACRTAASHFFGDSQRRAELSGQESGSLCTSPYLVPLNGPVNLNGSYLNAQFPQVDVNSHDQFLAVPMTNVLYPDDGNTARFRHPITHDADDDLRRFVAVVFL